MDRNTFILDAPQRELFCLFLFFFVRVSYHDDDRSIVDPNDHMAVLIIILMDFLILFFILLRVQGNKRWECM